MKAMELLYLLWPVFTIGSLYKVYSVSRARARGNMLVLCQWISAVVLGLGYSIAIYKVHQAGVIIGGLGGVLFLVFSWASFLSERKR